MPPSYHSDKFPSGLDLQGNTFWEFRDTLSSHKHRMRRIAQYPPSTHHSEIDISPQWHSWLRHTRSDPPSLTEQSQDLGRQANLKALAAAADARWATKPSFLDKPEQAPAQPLPGIATQSLGPHTEAPVSGNSGYTRATTRNDSGLVARADASAETSEEPPNMQGPDGVLPMSKEGPQQARNAGHTREAKENDPWKQSRGPSEQWKPAPWDGNVAPAKR